MRRKIYNFSQEERKQLRKNLEEILKSRKEIDFAYLYGSFLGDLPFHDMDVGVYAEGIKESEATFYAFPLAEVLSSALHLRVDVRVLNFAPVTFLFHVFRGELIQERNEDMRWQIMERTVQKYLDLKTILYRGMKEAFTA